MIGKQLPSINEFLVYSEVFEPISVGEKEEKAGKEAVKRGAPILGKGAGWVAKKGFEAAVNRGKKRGR